MESHCSDALMARKMAAGTGQTGGIDPPPTTAAASADYAKARIGGSGQYGRR